LRKLVIAASAALAALRVTAGYCAIAVEQIEAEDPSNSGSYTPVAFYGSQTETITGSNSDGFNNITFNIVGQSSNNSGQSSHAELVGKLSYGIQSPAYQSVTQVYCDDVNDFLNYNVRPLANVGWGLAPGNFSTGVKVVNNSYVTTYTPNYTISADTDALRRIDTMINNDNVTFVAAAVTGLGDGNYYDLAWSSFNSVAVAGNEQTFSPTGGPGKQHADLFVAGEASFATAIVSGYSTGLYANAQVSGQTDAMQNVVNRSLLMAGATNSGTRQTANNLCITEGAGTANYYSSLSIQEAGERPLLPAVSNNVTGTLVAGQSGWSYGTVPANSQEVVLFNSSNTITSLNASLNWNVYSTEFSGEIVTTNVTFPKLTLQVRSVTYSNGTWVLGANQSNPMLYSTATGDNVQYLYDPNSLPAGNYAFVISGDATLSTPVGFSFALGGNFASQWTGSAGASWGNASNWTANIPSGRGAQANLMLSSGTPAPGTITLDAIRTIGQLTYSNSNSCTIAAGTNGGSLNFDDTGDVNFVDPLINVLSGNLTISAPITTAAFGLTLTVSSAGSLTLSGPFNGSGPLAKSGLGTATFANPNTGILVRTLPNQLLIFGGTFSLGAEASNSNRQLLVAPYGVSIAGSAGNWTSKLDLNNNDLDIPGGSLATITNQLQEGYNGGKWNAAGGIVSTSASNDPNHMFGLGAIQNNQGGSQIYSVFDGYSAGATDILVKYTYYGDCNLDGKVDGSDYSLLDSAFLADASKPNTVTGWYNGDFNYDGTINGSDYTLADNGFNSQGAILADAVSTAQIATAQIAISSPVPEPAAIAICVSSALMLSVRRKQRFH
jgi:hypothetical protein